MFQNASVKIEFLSFTNRHLLIGCMQFGSKDQDKCEACGCLIWYPLC